MIRKIFLPTILVVLAYGFWLSSDFKEISAGVAIFLFGMLSLEEGFRAFTGGLLEKQLRRSTDRLWKSITFGFFTTSIMQSSSLVSVITISFLSAGLVSLAAGIGIIFGANIGTTTGAWLIAGFGLKINISAYAMPIIVFGVILLFQKSKHLKGIGYVLTGLGFLFLGIHYMKEGFEAFSGSIDLKEYAVSGYPGIFLFALLGLIATVVMQSSHATLVLIITALAAQQITYENALALAIGANIGTTITAILGSLSANVEGRRLAGAHLVFNTVTALLGIAFIYQLTDVVDLLSEALGIAADNYTLKLAVFHTLFNSIGVLVMTPFINPLVRILERILQPKIISAAQARYLREAALDFPETAIVAVRKETLRLYKKAFEIIARGLRIKPRLIRSDRSIESIIAPKEFATHIDIDEKYGQTIKVLYSKIIDFISQAQSSFKHEQADELFALRSAGRDIIEAIKDTKHLQKNLDHYMLSAHPPVREQYGEIRLKLAHVLRELELVRNNSDDSAAILSLDHLELEMQDNEARCDKKLDKLIRENLITADVATSLMNDNNYAGNVANKLISMARELFSAGDISTRGAERSLALEESEIGDALYHTKIKQNQHDS